MTVPQTAQGEVQAAVYAKLKPGGTLDSVLASIGVLDVIDFRAVLQNQPFPYITIGDGYELPRNALQERGYFIVMTIHIWSRYLGTDEATQILARINTLIDQQPLNLSTHRHVSTMYQRANWLADPDGLTTHVAARYEVFTQEN